MILKIKNAKVISGGEITSYNVYIEDDKIKAVSGEELYFDEEFDAEGNYLSSGFIDIHTHGAGGYDFGDGQESDILNGAYAHAKHGTTGIYPTCTSSSFDEQITFIRNVKSAMAKNAPGIPHILGSHLEGPYFNLKMCGAQNPEHIRTAKKEEYTAFVKEGEGTLRRISFAPEIEGTDELLDYLNEEKIVSSFGHTDGIYEEIQPYIDKGCRLATHLYSGMNTVTRRDLMRKLGAVETALYDDSVTVEVIADGIHLPKELLGFIYKIKGSDRVCLVTDSMRGAGCKEGRYILGPKDTGLETEVRNGVAYLTDMTAFAGSVATADRLVRVMYKEAKIPLCECIKMITETPANVMGVCDRGLVKEGYVADIVIFDDDINIKKVIIRGKELKDKEI